MRLLPALAALSLAASASATQCYECSSGEDATCNRYVGTTCRYGFFGCIKIATYSGGVNKSGR